MSKWEIIVGNVGTVFSGTSGYDARKVYSRYVRLSKNNEGRAAGEPVTIMRDDDIVREYHGTINAPAPEVVKVLARKPFYTFDTILSVARSLEPVAGTEYARGVTELIGRLVLDVSGVGEGTSENAEIFAPLVCKGD